MGPSHKTKSCHTVVKRIVTMTTLWLSSEKLSRLSTGTTKKRRCHRYNPDHPKVVNRWQLNDNSMTTLWHPFVLCAITYTQKGSKSIIIMNQCLMPINDDQYLHLLKAIWFFSLHALKRRLGTFNRHVPMILSNTYWHQSKPTSTCSCVKWPESSVMSCSMWKSP